jgi:hypothetical protein
MDEAFYGGGVLKIAQRSQLQISDKNHGSES